MNKARIIAEYVSKCAKNGISSIEDIHNQLKKDIKEIDEKLTSFDSLRIERANLHKVLEHFSAILQTDKMTSSFDDESEEMIEVKGKVIDFIEKNGSGTTRDIITSVGYNQDAKVVRVIKNLAEQGVIERDKENRINIVPGPSWNNYVKG